MNFLSKQNIFKALPESGDLKTAINRAFYFEPVSHVLRKYSSLSLFEEIIARTVEKSVGDSEHFTNLLIEHHEALSTFSVKDQPIEIEILEAPNTPKHQSIAAAQQKELISILSAKATPFTPKGKQKQVSYADMVKQDLKDDVSRSNSPLPSTEKKEKNCAYFKS
ncbi:hypothetical protein GLOIN_2v1473242 [Rhizophagus irregularis DAOM 181602=DAOM 197198]|nr:hypothetical protein GLOIN_2v1473242 [Rhizophagus irregularis DAOM 181602=DAOM 197198]